MRRHTSLSNRLPQDFIWLLEQRTTYSAFWLLCSICLENNSNALLWSRTGENEASCHHKLIEEKVDITGIVVFGLSVVGIL